MSDVINFNSLMSAIAIRYEYIKDNPDADYNHRKQYELNALIVHAHERYGLTVCNRHHVPLPVYTKHNTQTHAIEKSHDDYYIAHLVLN